MLIPQYSVRWLLGLTTAVAVLFSITALGLRGHAWAAAVAIAVLSVVISAVVYAAAFGVVWAFSVVVALFGAGSGGPGETPFGRPAVKTDDPPGDKDTPAAPIVLD